MNDEMWKVFHFTINIRTLFEWKQERNEFEDTIDSRYKQPFN